MARRSSSQYFAVWVFGSLIVQRPPSLQWSSSHKGLIPSTNYEHVNKADWPRRKEAYKVQECANWHDRGSSEVRLNLPKLANCLEIGDDFVGDLVSLRHIDLVFLLLDHSPHSVSLLQSEVSRRHVVHASSVRCFWVCFGYHSRGSLVCVSLLWLEESCLLSSVVSARVGD
jgi:hypothetical protein